ncbi:MAG: MFS transporter [Blastocatellia bacterium]|nr:MAG: MFS transporter [Blastocatellia bacterium]
MRAGESPGPPFLFLDWLRGGRCCHSCNSLAGGVQYWRALVVTPSGRSSALPVLQDAVSPVAYYSLALVTLLNFVNYIDRFILAAVLPRIKDTLTLSDVQLGFLANAFLVAYFLTSPVFGQLGDRGSRPRLMAAGVACWSLATAAAGLASNFLHLMMARAVVGVGEAAYATISPALLADEFPAQRRGRAFAIFYVAIPVGAAVGFLLGGVLERAFGWRSAFYVVGLPGLILAGLAMTIRDPPRGATDDACDVLQPIAGTLRALGRNYAYVGTVLGYAAYTFALGGLAVWMPTFLERVRGLELAEADFLVGSVTAVAGLGGTAVGGFVGDWLSSRIRHAHLWLSGVTTAAAVPPAWLALSASSHSVYQASFLIAEFLLFLSTGPVNVVIVSVVPASMRAMAMAVSIFAIHALGDAISPPIIGALADASGLERAVMIVPLAIAISGVIWIATAWLVPKE